MSAKLDTSIASLTEQLGDENVAPLYSWLDLVRQQRRAIARVEAARVAVAQTRAVRGPESPKMPEKYAAGTASETSGRSHQVERLFQCLSSDDHHSTRWPTGPSIPSY